MCNFFECKKILLISLVDMVLLSSKLLLPQYDSDVSHEKAKKSSYSIIKYISSEKCFQHITIGVLFGKIVAVATFTVSNNLLFLRQCHDSTMSLSSPLTIVLYTLQDLL